MMWHVSLVTVHHLSMVSWQHSLSVLSQGRQHGGNSCRFWQTDFIQMNFNTKSTPVGHMICGKQEKSLPPQGQFALNISRNHAMPVILTVILFKSSHKAKKSWLYFIMCSKDKFRFSSDSSYQSVKCCEVMSCPKSLTKLAFIMALLWPRQCRWKEGCEKEKGRVKRWWPALNTEQGK